MIPGVNIFNGKASVASGNRAGGSGGEGGGEGALSPLAVCPLRKILDSKEHLDWCKIDLNAPEIITV